MPSQNTYDLLAAGAVAVDEVLYVDTYPAADSKARVLRRETRCGGLAGNALAAAASLGGRCAYAGTLDHDPLSAVVLENFKRYKIDTQFVSFRKGARPVRSVIVVGQQTQTRNVFSHRPSMSGAPAGGLKRDCIASSRVLLVDHVGLEGSLRSARRARALGVPIVADFERRDGPAFDELISLVDHLIISHAFAQQLLGRGTLKKLLSRLWSPHRQVAIITCGKDGCFCLSNPAQRPEHIPAFQIDAIDTTGCGDVFHGAYALALARRAPLKERLLFASAAAALKAASRNGNDPFASIRDVARLLEEQARQIGIRGLLPCQ